MHFQQTSTPVRRPLRILCAEDTALLGEIIARLLQSRGHWVEHVLDGLEAWSRVELNLTRYDVVVTDQEMPGLNGLEFVARMAQAGYSGRIVVYSTSIPEEMAARYRAFGVHAIIGKSSRAENLIAAVEAVAGVEQTCIPS